MQVTYKLSVADYRNAIKLHYKLRGRWRSPLNIYYFMPFVGLIMIFSDIFEALHRDDYFSSSIWWSGVLGLVWLALPLLYRYSTQKAFRRMFPFSATETPLVIDIDEERIVSEMPGLSESKILWNAVVKFAQNQKVTLIYLAEIRFLFIPTSAFTPEQRAELNELVARHVRKENR